MARPVLESGRAVSFCVTGGSMRPFLHHGQQVTLERAAEYQPGDVVLALTRPDGAVVLHYVAEVRGDELTLMGAANLQQTERCGVGDVCGRMTSPAISRRRILFWHRLLPLRRFLLKLL